MHVDLVREREREHACRPSERERENMHIDLVRESERERENMHVDLVRERERARENTVTHILLQLDYSTCLLTHAPNSVIQPLKT